MLYFSLRGLFHEKKERNFVQMKSLLLENLARNSILFPISVSVIKALAAGWANFHLTYPPSPPIKSHKEESAILPISRVLSIWTNLQIQHYVHKLLAILLSISLFIVA